MKLLKEGLWEMPSTAMDWAACVFVFWLMGIPADWRWALYLLAWSFVGFFVRAGIQVYREPAPAPGSDLR